MSYSNNYITDEATMTKARSDARNVPDPVCTDDATSRKCVVQYKYEYLEDVTWTTKTEYELDQFGRVVIAHTQVGPAPHKREKLAAGVYQMTDMLFNPTTSWPAMDAPPNVKDWFRVKGLKGSRNADWEAGHIIASELGGSHAEPLNFFPQHRLSNSNNGRWWRIERIK